MKMRAVVYDRYGPPEVLRLKDVERPVPAADEVLVRIHATTVNRTDCGWRSATPWFARAFTGWRGPRRRILGSELAGVVEAIGADVREYAVGDRVFGAIGWGAHADHVAVREGRALAHLPDGASFEEAAAVCDGFVLASGCLEPARLGPGRRVLIYGASGSIGTAAVQVARSLGADVTAVCDTRHLELARSLGADRVIDYTREDFTRNGETYDAVFDAVGRHSFRRCRRSIRPGGMFITTDLGYLWHVPLLIVLTRWIGSRRVLLPVPAYTKARVLQVRELMEAGRYRAVIDRRFPLEQVVEATRYVETGQKTGNVVLTVVDGDGPSGT
jgi:NADPH:quinone reductase-like Zn-dependent oxidoreductase